MCILERGGCTSRLATSGGKAKFKRGCCVYVPKKERTNRSGGNFLRAGGAKFRQWIGGWGGHGRVRW